MKFLLFLICLLTFACRNKQSTQETKTSLIDSVFLAEHFDTSISYLEPCCLNYKSKPLLTIGQNVKELDSSLSFRIDPNGEYQNYFDTIKDYLSLDDYYTEDLSTGSIVGIIFFSADKKGRIFKLCGNWTIKAELVDTFGIQIIDHLRNKYFPCLPPDFKGRKQFELAHDNFIETFKLSTDSTGSRRYGLDWQLDYAVTLKKKNGL